MTEAEILTMRPNYARLDAVAAPEFKREIDAQVGESNRLVLLDLSDVQFMDSTGLGVLVSLLKRLGNGGRIAVIGAAPPVTKLFQITRLEDRKSVV